MSLNGGRVTVREISMVVLRIPTRAYMVRATG